MKRRRDDESGAIAVVVGFMMLVLLSVTALTVDLGVAWVQKRDVQKVVDFATLAGASGTNLPGTLNGTCSNQYNGPRAAASDRAVLDVALHLVADEWAVIPTATTLTDCKLDNGEVVYGTLSAAAVPTLAYDKSMLTVVSPARHVPFGLAAALGVNGTSVHGRATAAVGTPGSEKVFPAFATDGCDWGQRTIFAPAGSTTGPAFTPDLKYSSDKNFTSFDLSVENPSPDAVPVDPAPTTVTITGTGLLSVLKIGFFKEDPSLEPLEIAKASFDTQTATRITVTLPDDLPGLTGAAGLWWVRVYAPKASASDTTKQWSEVRSGSTLKTIPFEVGESFLRCAGVASGSFGDIILPRNDVVSSNWTPMNIAKNLDPGPPRLSLNTYPGSPTTVFGTSTAPNRCTEADPRTIYSTVTGSPVLKANTNCLDNGTGLTANVATSGLISGVRSGAHVLAKGRLDTGVGTTCAPLRSVSVTGPSATFLINDDRLTCFMSPGVTVGMIASKSYSGGPVVSCAIFDSPRFFYQPVFQVRPEGGSDHYTVVDFRPAFVSEQGSAAQHGDSATPNNGVTMDGGQVKQLDVIFFHPEALPKDCPTGFGPLLGGTTSRSVRLVD